MKNGIENQKVTLTFGQLKKLVSESEDSSGDKFRIGCKYRWWSKATQFNGYEFIVVDIAPDRSYILTIPNNGILSAEKYEVKTDNDGHERITDHPAPYIWRVSQADKGGEYVGVPDGWFDAAKARRVAGASAAVNTRMIKTTLKKVAKNMTADHLYELRARSFSNGDPDAYEKAIETIRQKGWDAKVEAYGEPCKIRGPKMARGKTLYGLMIGLDNGKLSSYLGYDGEKFYYGWDSFKDGLSDDEIRKILSDII